MILDSVFIVPCATIVAVAIIIAINYIVKLKMTKNYLKDSSNDEVLVNTTSNHFLAFGANLFRIGDIRSITINRTDSLITITSSNGKKTKITCSDVTFNMLADNLLASVDYIDVNEDISVIVAE